MARRVRVQSFHQKVTLAHRPLDCPERRLGKLLPLPHYLWPRLQLRRSQSLVGAEMSLTVLSFNIKRVMNIIGVKKMIEAVT